MQGPCRRGVAEAVNVELARVSRFISPRAAGTYPLPLRERVPERASATRGGEGYCKLATRTPHPARHLRFAAMAHHPLPQGRGYVRAAE